MVLVCVPVSGQDHLVLHGRASALLDVVAVLDLWQLTV